VSNPRSTTLTLRTSEDLVRMRQAVREHAIELGFGLVDQTKLVTAASELARNTIQHGGGGQVDLETIVEDHRRGICLTFTDRGPGIRDIEMALKDGYTSGTGLGLGLGGARRLSSEFHISSEVGAGTRVVIRRWR
jgi:serine/threonine-protein kinase RsbT